MRSKARSRRATRPPVASFPCSDAPMRAGRVR